jgi:hypothetical protein
MSDAPSLTEKDEDLGQLAVSALTLIGIALDYDYSRISAAMGIMLEELWISIPDADLRIRVADTFLRQLKTARDRQMSPE